MARIRNWLSNCLVTGTLTSIVLLHGPAATAATETILHSFQDGGSDGYNPNAGLIKFNGSLYGTTTYGGSSPDCAGGCGAVFKIDPKTGAETIVSSFGSTFDGFWPYGGLLNVKGTLYGTTAYGGNSNEGTVFSVDPATGTETVVFSFSGADGSTPYAGLINVQGTLYGTTASGGAHGFGTVFLIDLTTGAERVLHSFGGTDGSGPVASLINVKGALYGTTQYGGAAVNCATPGGCGTIFKVKLATGAERVVYSFCKKIYCADGAYPPAGLSEVGGLLYGTTANGGTGCGPGCGTVFSLSPRTGKEKVVHYFSFDGVDGAYPAAGLTNVGGVLYGTTSNGGTGSDGAVFSLDPATGAETIVYSFQGGGADGRIPHASVIEIKGALYGTTWAGGGTGCSQLGCGTVFKIAP